MSEQTWQDLLYHPPASLRLTYSVPGGLSPYGDYTLVLRPYGQARLDNQVAGIHKTWTGQVEQEVITQLLDALRIAGFPAVPDLPMWLVPDTVIVTIAIVAGGQQGKCTLDLQNGNNDPSCRLALQLLESICFQLSEESLKYCRNQLPPVVKDVKQAH